MLYNGVDITYKTKTSSVKNKGSISNANGVTKAVFFKHKDGTMAPCIMELALNDAYFQSKKVQNAHKGLSLLNVSKDFTGFLIFTNLSGKPLANYRFENGKVVAKTKKSDSTSKSGRVAYCEYDMECYQIETTVTVGCCTDGEYNYNPTGNCCRDATPPYTRSDTYCDLVQNCYPDPPTDPTDGGTGGPGGPNDPGNSNPTTVDLVIDPNLNDCFKGVINTITSDRLKNYVSSQITRLYGPTLVRVICRL